MADEAGGGPLSPAVAKARGQTLRLTGQILDQVAPEQLLMTPVAAEGIKPSNTMGVERRKSTGQVFLTNQIVSLCGLDPSEETEPGEQGELFGTPTARMWKGGGEAGTEAQKARSAKRKVEAQVLDVHLLGTPRCAAGMKHDMRDPEVIGDPRSRLEDQIGKLLPTTTAADAKASGGAAGSPNVTLTDAVVRERGATSLLPTPTAAQSGNTPEDHLRKKPGRTVVTDLGILVENDLIETGGRLLPTTRATDGTKGGPNQRGSSGDLMLPSAVQTLLPTPQVHDATKGKTAEQVAAMRARGHGVSNLNETIENDPLLNTPSVADGAGGHLTRGGERSDEKLLPGQAKDMSTNWGPYERAIRRWERVLGRPAPAPTEPNTKGGQRLSPWFTEWMMGAPHGWICDIEITRNEKLKACGNGVVRHQAAAALGDMLRSFNG